MAPHTLLSEAHVNAFRAGLQEEFRLEAGQPPRDCGSAADEGADWEVADEGDEWRFRWRTSQPNLAEGLFGAEEMEAVAVPLTLEFEPADDEDARAGWRPEVQGALACAVPRGIVLPPLARECFRSLFTQFALAAKGDNRR